MKNISKLAALALVAVIGTQMTFAQTTVTEPAAPNTVTTAKPKQIREAAQSEIKTIRNKVQESTSVAKGELKAKIESIRETASSTKGEIKQQMQTARQEIQNKRDELRNTVENRKIVLMKQWGEKTIKRLEEAVTRLEKLAERINARIVKMKANKIDTATADASLITAKQKIAEAKTSLETAKTAIADIGTQAAAATDANEAKNIVSQTLPKIKEQVRVVNDSLKAAHQALVQTITDLKGKEGVKKTEKTPTSATSTN
ncbi:MAG: hypothetical protein NTZ13_01525 [Candidatus Parcubacteria bacterium]|nr:hypothetical protein [Candidatus Parcubacteria bacterium]